MKKRSRIILFTLLTILVLPLLVAAFAMGMLQSATGQGWLVARVPGWTGGMVQLESPDGAWPQHVKLGRVTVKDRQGPWLVIDGIELQWQPWALLSRHVAVDVLQVKKIAVQRLPISESTAQMESAGGFNPNALPKIDLRKIAIDEIALAPDVAGYAQRLRVQGDVANGADGMLVGTLRIDTLEGLLTRLALDAKQTRDGLSGTLTAEEAAGGMVGKMLLLDPAQNLRMSANAVLAGSDANADLTLQEGARDLLKATVKASGVGAAIKAHIMAEGQWPGQLAADPQLAVLLGDQPYQLDTQIAMQEQAIAWNIAALHVGPVLAKGEGSFQLNNRAKLAADLVVNAELAGLSALAGQPLEGHAALAVQASGTLAQPTAKLDVTLNDVKAQGQSYPPLQLVAQLTPGEKTLNLSPLQLSAGNVVLSGGATYDMADTHWAAGLAMAPTGLQTLASLLPPHSVPVAWQGALVLNVTAGGVGADAQAAIRAGLTEIAGLDAPLNDVLGREVAVQATITHENGTIQWSQTSLTTNGGLQLESEGSFADVLNAKAQLRLKDARVLGAGIPGGSPEMLANISGPTDALKLESTLAWAAPDLPKLTGEIAALLQPEWLTLNTLQLRAADAVLEAKGKYPLAKGAADMDATVRVADLGVIGRYADQSLAGSAQGKAALKGPQLQAEVSLRNLAHPSAKLANAQLNAKITDIRTQDGIQAMLVVHDAQGEGWQLASVQAHAQSQTKAANASLPPILFGVKGKGVVQGKPLLLATNGQFRMEKQAQLVEIVQLKGQVLGEPFGLDRALQLRMEGEQIVLAPTTLRFGAMVVQARWAQAPQSLDGALSLAPIALKNLPGGAGLPDGTVQASVAATGTPASPALAVNAKGEMKMQEANVPPLTWKADVNWQGGPTATPLNMALNAEAGTDAKVSAHVQTRGQLQLAPFTFALPDTAPLQGQAQLALLLEMLNPWLRGQGHKLAGKADGTIQIGGTVGKPEPNGQIALNGIRYDHLTSGACVQGLSGQIQASPDAVQLINLKGVDPHGGSMQLSGGVQLASPMRTDIALSLKDYQLFCGGMLTGAMAGDIHANGEAAGNLKVDGTLIVGPLSVNLPESNGASGIPQVKVLNDERAKAAAEAKRAGQAESNIALNIVVDADAGRIFVRGRGLDTEFAGKLKVNGTASKPDVVGTLRTKRGKFNLLERQLLISQGELRFEGAVPPSPCMTIVAESKASDATAKVTLEGSALNPKLTLSSTPALPQDEVLARLLFGRDLQSISPYQALQLARAARQLAGKGGGGPDMLGKLRGALGLDTLSVDQDSSGETTLGTGKYLADGVYVGVEQGRTPESRRIKTELEVIPSITVQTMTGSKGETGGGVEWKYDY